MAADSLPENWTDRKPPEWGKRFHAVHARIVRRVDNRFGQYNFCSISDLCESDIERIFAAELLDLFAPLEFDQTIFWPNKDRITIQDAAARFVDWEKRRRASSRSNPLCAIFPQVLVDYGRVDFFVLSSDVAGKHTGRLVIECDGHDYHERTKEQAARDRSRDRALTRDGMPFLRFTGSEIYHGSQRCMTEVERLLWRQMHEAECPDLRESDEEPHDEAAAV